MTKIVSAFNETGRAFLKKGSIATSLLLFLFMGLVYIAIVAGIVGLFAAIVCLVFRSVMGL